MSELRKLLNVCLQRSLQNSVGLPQLQGDVCMCARVLLRGSNLGFLLHSSR